MAASAENAQANSKDARTGTEIGKAFYGYLFDKTRPGKVKPTPVLDALLRAVALHIMDKIGDKTERALTPKKLAAFYKAVGGNYDQLFQEVPYQSISYIWQATGCQHSLQPTDDDFAPPLVPALTLKGFVRWESIEILLGPEEHVPFLQYAVANWNLESPDDGTPFPVDLPKESFPRESDAEIDQWHRDCANKLRAQQAPQPGPKVPMPEPDVNSSHVRLDPRAAAAAAAVASTRDYLNRTVRSVGIFYSPSYVPREMPGEISRDSPRHRPRMPDMDRAKERDRDEEMQDRYTRRHRSSSDERTHRWRSTEHLPLHDVSPVPRAVHVRPPPHYVGAQRPPVARRHSHGRHVNSSDTEENVSRHTKESSRSPHAEIPPNFGRRMITPDEMPRKRAVASSPRPSAQTMPSHAPLSLMAVDYLRRKNFPLHHLDTVKDHVKDKLSTLHSGGHYWQRNKSRGSRDRNPARPSGEHFARSRLSWASAALEYETDDTYGEVGSRHSSICDRDRARARDNERDRGRRSEPQTRPHSHLRDRERDRDGHRERRSSGVGRGRTSAEEMSARNWRVHQYERAPYLQRPDVYRRTSSHADIDRHRAQLDWEPRGRGATREGGRAKERLSPRGRDWMPSPVGTHTGVGGRIYLTQT